MEWRSWSTRYFRGFLDREGGVIGHFRARVQVLQNWLRNRKIRKIRMFFGSMGHILSVFDFWVWGYKPIFLPNYSDFGPIWGYPQNAQCWTYFGDNFVNIGQKHLKSRSKWPPVDLEVFWIWISVKILKIGQSIAILLFFRYTPYLGLNGGMAKKQ